MSDTYVFDSTLFNIAVGIVEEVAAPREPLSTEVAFFNTGMIIGIRLMARRPEYAQAILREQIGTEAMERSAPETDQIPREYPIEVRS